MPDKPKVCDLEATDSGKACTDSIHCQGDCLAPGNAIVGTKLGGSCSAYVTNFGSLKLVVDGVVEQRNVE